MNTYLTGWKKAFDFDGRTGRKEYWTFGLINIVVLYGTLIFAVMTNDAMLVIPLVFGMAVFIPTLSNCVRRLHDTNHSGAWILASGIPVLNIVLLVFYLSPGIYRASENNA